MFCTGAPECSPTPGTLPESCISHWQPVFTRALCGRVFIEAPELVSVLGGRVWVQQRTLSQVGCGTRAGAAPCRCDPGDRGQGQPLLVSAVIGLPVISDCCGWHSCRRKQKDHISYALCLLGHLFVGAWTPAEHTAAAVLFACRCVFCKDIPSPGKKGKYCLKQAKLLPYLDLV